MSDEDFLRSMFDAATRDLRAPEVRLRPRPTVVPLPTRAAPPARTWPRRVLMGGVAAAAGAVAMLVAVVGLGSGSTSRLRPVPGSGRPAAGTTAVPSGSAVLYQLASTVRALPVPTGRYAVQIEQQSEGPTSYLKASIVDSRTGDTWTYQLGPGVPSSLPMAPGFLPSEAQLQASDPTDPARLRAVLIQQASAGNPVVAQTANDLAVTQAVDTLWNPLVQPQLRAALVSVIASSSGVTTDPHATDSRGRRSIRISYDDAGLGMRLSLYLDPATGRVLESSQQPYTATADPSLAGKDVYMSQYWTDKSPAVNPLDH